MSQQQTASNTWCVKAYIPSKLGTAQSQIFISHREVTGLKPDIYSSDRWNQLCRNPVCMTQAYVTGKTTDVEIIVRIPVVSASQGCPFFTTSWQLTQSSNPTYSDRTLWAKTNVHHRLWIFFYHRPLQRTGALIWSKEATQIDHWVFRYVALTRSIEKMYNVDSP